MTLSKILQNCNKRCLREFTSNLYLAPPFLVGDYETRAAKTYREGKMRGKVELALKELECCVACPRNCKINRIENKKGACNTGRWQEHLTNKTLILSLCWQACYCQFSISSFW